MKKIRHLLYSEGITSKKFKRNADTVALWMRIVGWIAIGLWLAFAIIESWCLCTGQADLFNLIK
jgi:hypothetical protein